MSRATGRPAAVCPQLGDIRARTRSYQPVAGARAPETVLRQVQNFGGGTPEYPLRAQLRATIGARQDFAERNPLEHRIPGLEAPKAHAAGLGLREQMAIK